MRGSRPFGLSLFEDWVYWTDWRGRVIQANRFVPQNPVILLDHLEEPRGVVVAHISKQPPGH